MNVYMKDNFCTIYKLKFHQLQQYLEAHGMQTCYRLEDADMAVSGVCAAFEADEERSAKLMNEIAESGIPHHAIGCLISVNPGRVVADFHYKTWEFSKIAQVITGVESQNYDNRPLPSRFRCKDDYRVYDPARRFIGVSTGCGFECSYCPHILGAGPVTSRPVDTVINDVKLAIHEGASIIHLTGLDTASYGTEFGVHFGELLGAILGSVGDEVVFHIAQFNPEGLGTGNTLETLLLAFADRRVVDIQLPIQTASKRILHMMKRNYDIDAVSEFIKRLISINPKVFLRTDVMVGFPTDTLCELENTISFVEKLFHEVALYIYEEKYNTPCSSISDSLKHTREEQKAMYNYATERLCSKGLIVHSGGQLLSSLVEADKIKCAQSPSPLIHFEK